MRHALLRPFQVKLADDLIAHLNTMIPAIGDPFIVSRYVGLAAVAGVTSYELAVRDIYYAFAEQKHTVLASFTRSFFERLNGRVRIQHIRDDYCMRFGTKYKTRIGRRLQELDQRILRTQRKSPLASYGNLITWRHLFVHEGTLPTNATYAEAVDSYELGKLVIHCLAACMNR
jgi:hypothetical protein